MNVSESISMTYTRRGRNGEEQLQADIGENGLVSQLQQEVHVLLVDAECHAHLLLDLVPLLIISQTPEPYQFPPFRASSSSSSSSTHSSQTILSLSLLRSTSARRWNPSSRRVRGQCSNLNEQLFVKVSIALLMCLNSRRCKF